MTLFSYRAAVIGLATVSIAASACGARSGFLDDGADHDGTRAPPLRDGGIGPTGNTPLSRLCAFDASPDSARAVLAVEREGKLLFVRSDGSQIGVHDLPKERGVGWSMLLANANHVFVAVSFDDGVTGAHQALLDTTGAVRWMRQESAGTEVYPVTMNERGVVAEFTQTVDAIGHVTAEGLLVVDADGAARTAPNFAPVGAPGVDGAVPVQSTRSSASSFDDPMQLGWLRTDGSLHPIEGAWTGASHFAFDGTRFVHLDPSGTQLIVESQTERRSIPLPFVQSTSQKTTLRGHWALLGNDAPLGNQVRVDLDAATAAMIAAPPAGLRRFADGERSLDDDGNVLDALRDDYFGRMYRSSDLGKSWQPIGGTARRTSELHGAISNGTYVVASATAFVGETDWPEPPAGRVADVTGDGWQITRPSLNRARVLSRAQGLTVSNDGLCAAYVEDLGSSGYVLRVWDLETDRTVDVMSQDVPMQLRWIEVQKPDVQSQ